MLPLPIEVIAGACAGVLLFRLGLPTLIPLLLWIPLLQSAVSIGFVLGLISSSVWQLARPLFSSGQGFPRGIWISLACAGVGLLLVENVIPFLPLLEWIIAPILVFAVSWLLFFSKQERVSRVRVIVVSLAALGIGWITLHVWVIPLALPALLLGLFGFSTLQLGEPLAREKLHAGRESVLGVALGILPGLGPGLMGLLWGSNHFSPFTAIANLIFSLGYVVLSGKVRSMPAELFATSSFAWGELFVLLVGGICVAWGLEQLLPLFSFSFPFWFWSFLHVLALVLVGSVSTLLLVVVAFAWAQAAKEWGVSPSLGLLVLIPSIVWFYS